MGRAELTEALRRDGEARIRQVWLEAERQVAAGRDDVRRRQRSLLREFHGRCRERLARLRSDLQSAAGAELDRERGRQQQELAEQAWQLARDRLWRLAATPSRAELFQALAAELPPAEWDEVRVHPDDARLAGRLFGAGAVTPDREISGGLLVCGDAGRIEIDNRLETRLERAWPELLASVLSGLRSHFEGRHVAS